MKKIIVAVSALVLGTSAMAQTDKGGWMFGAGSDFSFVSSKFDSEQDESASDMNLNVSAGYFVMDNLSVGLGLGYGSSKEAGADDAVSSFVVGPMVRYYLPMKVFGQLSYQIGSVSAGGEKLYSTGDLGIGVGYAAFLNDNISIEPMVRYDMTSAKPDEGDSVSGSAFGLFINFGIYLGN